MKITITPFTVYPRCDCMALPVGNEQEEHIKENNPRLPIGGFILTTSTYLMCRVKNWLKRQSCG